MKIVAMGASSSKASINRHLADFAANQITGAKVNLLDLNDFEMPIFSVDREADTGIPQLAQDFRNALAESDGIIISFAEHNGAYSAAFKNIMDWISRIDSDVWCSKPMFLMATSPGPRGGATVLDIALNKFKWMNKSPLIGFSLPSFNDNLKDNQIKDAVLKKQFEEQLQAFVAAVKEA